MAKNKLTAEVLAERRRAVLELALLQLKLRDALKTLMHERSLNIDGVARELGLHQLRVKTFLGGRLAVCGGKILRSITRFVNLENLREPIKAAAAPLSDHLRGMAAFSTETIELVFDVQEAYLPYARQMSFVRFAHAFAPHTELLAKIMQCSSKALAELENETLRLKLRTTLTSEIWKSRLSDPATPREKTDRLHELVNALSKRYGSRQTTASALKVHRTTLTEALRGKASGKTIDMLIARAARLAGEPSDTPPHEHEEERSPLEQLGGETSPLGVRFVIGEASFRPIAGNPGKEGLAFARRSIEMTRAMLNIFAQLDDSAIRALVREHLGKEVEELELSIRLFTAKYPNRLTTLHDAQRDFWAKNEPNAPRRKGDR